MMERFNIKLHVKNFPAMDGLVNYANKRLAVLGKYSLVMGVDVHLEEQRGRYKGVGVMKLKGKTVRVETVAKDPMAVIDEIKDMLVREARQNKERVKRKR